MVPILQLGKKDQTMTIATPDIFLNAILALLAIVNPITVVPMYAELASDLPIKERRHFYDLSVITAFIALTILTFTGRIIMEYVFQIHVSEFRIAGGILLFIVAVKQIAFTEAEEFHTDKSKIMELGIVPMAIPMLIGPGSIVTSILILDRDGWIVATASILINFVVAFFVIRSSLTISRVIGKFGSMAIARILWIFIAAIGIRFLITGLAEIFSLNLPFGY
jgi:multiple antibiotic resistance protein